jgi:hypothetical protein
VANIVFSAASRRASVSASEYGWSLFFMSNSQLSYSDITDAANLKIERAKHHINDASLQINAYLEKRPLRLVCEFDSKAYSVAHYIEVNEPVPKCVALTIGDAVHNLRAALDMTIFAMIGDKSTKPWTIQFPIARREDTLVSTMTSRQTNLAGENVVNYIKGLKPYHGGSEWISGLDDLDVTDKHKLILTVANTASLAPALVAQINPSLQLRDYQRLVLPIGGGLTTVYNPKSRDERRILSRKYKIAKQEMNPQPTFEICFGESHPFRSTGVITTLRLLTAEIEKIVDGLAKAFLAD